MQGSTCWIVDDGHTFFTHFYWQVGSIYLPPLIYGLGCNYLDQENMLFWVYLLRGLSVSSLMFWIPEPSHKSLTTQLQRSCAEALNYAEKGRDPSKSSPPLSPPAHRHVSREAILEVYSSASAIPADLIASEMNNPAKLFPNSSQTKSCAKYALNH